jgi:hypothetical protein
LKLENQHEKFEEDKAKKKEMVIAYFSYSKA